MADPSGLHSGSRALTDSRERAARKPRYKTIASSVPDSGPIYTTPTDEGFSPVERPYTPPGSEPDTKTFDYVPTNTKSKIPMDACYVAAWYSQDYLTLVNHRTPLRTVTLLGSSLLALMLGQPYRIIQDVLTTSNHGQLTRQQWTVFFLASF